MTNMTFEQFIATARQCDDLIKVFTNGEFDSAAPAVGRTYLGDKLFIQEVTPDWPAQCQEQGRWYLILENQEWIDDDLILLETILFNYAIVAGFDLN